MHARPDGSMPPSPRFLHEDPYSAARYAAGLPWIDRHMLDKRRQVIVDDLDALDAEGVEWMRRRRTVLNDALGDAREAVADAARRLGPPSTAARPGATASLRERRSSGPGRRAAGDKPAHPGPAPPPVPARAPCTAPSLRLRHRLSNPGEGARRRARPRSESRPGRARSPGLVPRARRGPTWAGRSRAARRSGRLVPGRRRPTQVRALSAAGAPRPGRRWAPRRRRPQPRPLARYPDRRAPIRAARRHW